MLEKHAHTYECNDRRPYNNGERKYVICHQRIETYKCIFFRVIIGLIMHGDEKIIYANNLKFDKYWKRKIKKSIQHSVFFYI
jgi:hypothetical protein